MKAEAGKGHWQTLAASQFNFRKENFGKVYFPKCFSVQTSLESVRMLSGGVCVLLYENCYSGM